MDCIQPIRVDELFKQIERAIKSVDEKLKLEIAEPINEGNALCLAVINSLGDRAFTMNISFKENKYITTIKTIHGVEIVAASPEKMLVDKILVLSSNKIFMRAKDLHDIRVLMQLSNLRINNIWKILKETDKTLGNFNEQKKRVRECI